MARFKVELIAREGDPQFTDSSYVIEVEADHEVEALLRSKAELKKTYPSSNLSRVWCWHIESLAPLDS